MSEGPITVLLVEDNPGDARLIRAMLAEATRPRFELEHVDRLAAARDRLARGGIDVVLLDLALPDSQGLETFARTHRLAPDAAVVVLTGLDDQTLAVAAVGQGAQDYLVKGEVHGDLLGRAIRYALERKRAQEALRARAGQQAVVAELAQRALAGRDVPALMEDAVALAAETLGVEYCKVLELLPGGQTLRLRAGVGWQAGLVGRATVPGGEGSQAGYTLLSREPVIVEDLRAETRFSGPPLLHEHGVVSGVSVAIHGPTQPFGVLGAHTHTRRTFTRDDVHFLQDLANMLGLAIERSRAEAQYRGLLESAPDAIVIVDGEGRIALVNAQAETMFGYGRDELIGKPVETLLPERFRGGHLAHRRRYHLDPRTRPMGAGLDLAARRRVGTEFPVEISLSPLTTDKGVLITSVIRDITERKRAEEALRHSEERFRSAFEHSSIGMALQGMDGRYLRVNRALADMLGYSEDELLAAAYRTFTHPQDLVADLEDERRMLEGEAPSYQREKRYVHRGGHVVWALVSVSMVRDASGQPMYFLVQSQDISQRKALEEQLRQTQKMEAIGKLAGGVAHDFNNLLTVITGRTHLVLDRLGADDPLRQNIELIDKTAFRAAGLTRQLLAFSRKQILQPKVLDLNALVANMEDMLRRMIGEDIELITVPGGALGHVKADPVQLEQVVLNLALNARDAMPRGGHLTIETANVELDETYAHRGRVAVRPGPHVMLAVSDTGVGMDAETQSHLFEPFFTTKEIGKGTGLGLATVYGIVNQSSGNVWVYSEPGRGTTVKIYLPRVEDVAERHEAAPGPTPLPSGSETVLLVEDDEEVRSLAREVLEAAGYIVLEARHGSDAVTLAQGRPGPIHLLVTDVVMPQMSGQEVAERLTALHPEMRVLYMSGYTDNAIVHHGVLEPGVVLLQKPFTPDALVRRVREVLDASRGDSA